MSTEIVGSKIPADNKSPGQNGYEGASSLTPGQNAPAAANRVASPAGSVPTDDWQTRGVSAEQKVATTFGNKASTPNPATVPGNNRPVTKR